MKGTIDDIVNITVSPVFYDGEARLINNKGIPCNLFIASCYPTHTNPWTDYYTVPNYDNKSQSYSCTCKYTTYFYHLCLSQLCFLLIWTCAALMARTALKPQELIHIIRHKEWFISKGIHYNIWLISLVYQWNNKILKNKLKHLHLASMNELDCKV